MLLTRKKVRGNFFQEENPGGLKTLTSPHCNQTLMYVCIKHQMQAEIEVISEMGSITFAAVKK